MNAYELQALRHIFAMTIDECATWIAQTGDSESWRQWENGKCAIPDRVVEVRRVRCWISTTVLIRT